MIRICSFKTFKRLSLTQLFIVKLTVKVTRDNMTQAAYDARHLITANKVDNWIILKKSIIKVKLQISLLLKRTLLRIYKAQLVYKILLFLKRFFKLMRTYYIQGLY